MLVEYSKQVSWFIYEVWNAIYGFANSLRPGDWVAVIGYDMRPTILSDFTQDRNKLNEALRRFQYPAFSESNLSDALIDTLDRVEEIDGKVAVLLVSTGLDTFSRHTYDEALKKCKAANAIDLRHRPRPELPYPRRRRGLHLPGAEPRTAHVRQPAALLRRVHRRRGVLPALRHRIPFHLQQHLGDAAQPVQHRVRLDQHKERR